MTGKTLAFGSFSLRTNYNFYYTNLDYLGFRVDREWHLVYFGDRRDTR